jgi:geranylgeranyl pyrophosphate synthase/predicted secreted hydrolase
MATTQTSPSLVKGAFTKTLPNIKINGGGSRSVTPSPIATSFRTKSAPTDPRITDAPQLQAKTEWWYLQSHLTSGISDDPRHTVIVCVFRHKPDDPAGEDGWAVIYGTIDWMTHEYKTYSKVPKGMAGRAAQSMADTHSLLSRTIQKLVDTGPGGASEGAAFLPDALFDEVVKIRKPAEGWAPGPALQLDWDRGASLVGENGAYHLKVPEIQLDIQVQATSPMLLHGYDGVTLKGDERAMFYYSWPRTEVVGEYRGDRVVGTAWYDHEYSLPEGDNTKGTGSTPPGWRWFSLLTVGGSKQMEICITQLVQNGETPEQYLVWVDENGERQRDNQFKVTMVDDWVSAQTFQRYGVNWRIEAPHLDVDIHINTVAMDQEFQTWVRVPSFYEGAVRFHGKWGGTPIKGFGAMELVNEVGSADSFMNTTLSNATSLVMSEIEKVIPQGVEKGHLQYVTKLPFDADEETIVQQSVVDAFYMYTNRGGKNWRPMLLGASAGIVGGKANDWRAFLVFPEMIHTASLIIDDIEDDSETRRGGPCVHKVMGVPTAINAGCAMYFWGETVIRDCENLTETQRRDFYQSYFEMMRVAHAGQALDIKGMTMEKLPTLEEAEAMKERIINLHRCKSGRPAASCGFVGASLGGGTPEQIAAIGNYVQNLGIAFQIRDDVLDVLGKVRGKQAADDLYNHKITYPVAMLFTLDHPDREKWFSLWEKRDVPAFVEVLKSTGVLDTCNQHIEDMIEQGWDRVNQLTPNSFSKILFRMFGSFLVDEHY